MHLCTQCSTEGSDLLKSADIPNRPTLSLSSVRARGRLAEQIHESYPK